MGKLVSDITSLNCGDLCIIRNPYEMMLVGKFKSSDTEFGYFENFTIGGECYVPPESDCEIYKIDSNALNVYESQNIMIFNHGVLSRGKVEVVTESELFVTDSITGITYPYDMGDSNINMLPCTIADDFTQYSITDSLPISAYKFKSGVK